MQTHTHVHVCACVCVCVGEMGSTFTWTHIPIIWPVLSLLLLAPPRFTSLSYNLNFSLVLALKRHGIPSLSLSLSLFTSLASIPLIHSVHLFLHPALYFFLLISAGIEDSSPALSKNTSLSSQGYRACIQ